ncbi:MAG: hypothetical protein IT299_02905 [Dehalococcoidia bacterium]|nr:hypothetical protein [Dehalococcoidia bacterium]
MQPAAVRLLSWAPQYGTSMMADAEAPPPRVDIDTTVEQSRWAAVVPRSIPGAEVATVRLVDGVRRVEAHAFADDGGEPRFGLFGSFAVGAVQCGAGRASFIEDTLRLERRYLQAGGEAADVEVRLGRTTLRFLAELRPEASANGLVDALNRAMLDAEALLADSLARDDRDDEVLTLVDGPLRRPQSSGRRLAGYVKRVVHWYVSPAEQRLLARLGTGERTPLFRVSDPTDTVDPGRLCWYVRIADLPATFHPLSGILRLETHGAVPLARAVSVADEATSVLPRFASSLARDPRAPQNLVPVGALEAYLTHRLGDREWIRRALTAHLARANTTARLVLEPAPEELSA